MTDSISFFLNGRSVSVAAGDDGTLLWSLRTELDATGTKFGCGVGFCGACTVLLDGRPVRSCVTPVAQAAGRRITTIEGLATPAALHPLQQAFIDHGAFQCGYCTSGMLLTAHALLQENPKPTRAEIIAYMDHNLCRCGAHRRIVDAIASVASGAVADAHEGAPS